VHDIERYFDELKITIDEDSLMRILERLAEDQNIFRWFQFICKKLPLVAKADLSFINLISKIIQKVKKDMAACFLANAFIEIGIQNPHLGLELFQMATANNDDDLKLWSGAFLGGVGRVQPNLVFEKIESEYGKADPYVKSAFIKAIRISRGATTKIPEKILEILKMATKDNNVVVRAEAIAICIEFFDIAPDDFSELLHRLAIEGTAEDKFHIAACLQSRELSNKQFELEILQICSEDSDIQVLNVTAQALQRRAKENPEKVLDILKTWIVRRIFHKIHAASLILDSFEESNLEKCFAIVESWVEHPDALLQFEIPRLLSKVFFKDPIRLVSLLDKWKDKSEKFTKVIITTLREILSEVYSGTLGKEVIDSSFTLLQSLAEKKGLDVNQIVKAESDKLFQAFRLIEELEIERPELDYGEVFQNLNRYPAIQNFLGLKWFEKMKCWKNRTHPLLVFLATSKLNVKRAVELIDRLKKERDEFARLIISDQIFSLLYATSFLEHLNAMLGLFDPKEQGTRHIRAGLYNEDQFWQTISELEIVTSFKAKYPTTIEPKVDETSLDVQVMLNNNTILIEVTNPEMFKPLRYVTAVIGLKNRAKQKIVEKIDNQLKKLIGKIKNPLLLAIDISRSEIDYEDVIASLEGSLAIRLILDKQTRQVVTERLIRDKDSLPLEKPEAKIVSAIMAFRRKVGENGKMILEGKIFKNNVALYPLADPMIEMMEESIFKKED